MSTTKKELKDYEFKDHVDLRNRTVEALNEDLRAMHKKEFTGKRVEAKVGGGTQVGDEFTLTGEVTIGEIQGSTNVFLAVKATTGETIPIKALIAQSVSGYKAVGKFYDELTPLKNGEDEDAHKQDENYREYEPTFDKSIVGDKEAAEVVKANRLILNHGTRSDIELYGMIKEGLWVCKDFKLLYCGKVYRQTTASHDYEFGENTVKKGARRAMSVSVWKIIKPKTTK